ncbi:DUF1266 domain-containing protein [Chitinophaga sedimenti]|uniref:DUF1266 domain-containing protein n=1 Tax=Chitinophaga sedimenti TaxID=2033606 RepID=UPI0020057883|nr:DUF1266 domain-containing protein [Chitinophaga sedimenti]MCK7553726.1 DUF1266 domain-containing protein [Chitinophaga sedimenti]
MVLSSFNTREDREKALSHVEHLKETIPVLIAKGIINSEEDVVHISINAWDYGRIVFLARLCYEAGYLTEREVWHFIHTGDELAQQQFNDWATFGKSYVLGRAMWGGSARGNDETIEIYRYLMTDPQSPWVKLPWRQHAKVKF